MPRIDIPKLSDLHCAWADEWDARAMIGRAEAISRGLSRIEHVGIFGTGTTTLDMNGLPRHSSFGTRLDLAGGGTISISLALSKEARATTDDLTFEMSGPGGPRLAIALRLPAHRDAGRPGLVEALELQDGLRALGEHLIAPMDGIDRIATGQQSITDALAALLGHLPRMRGRRFVRISTDLAGSPTTVEIVTDGQGSPDALDARSAGILMRRIAPCGSMHLETHGGHKGKTYRTHGLKTTAPIPEERPDPIRTMRLLGELGLSDLPTIAGERR